MLLLKVKNRFPDATQSFTSFLAIWPHRELFQLYNLPQFIVPYFHRDWKDSYLFQSFYQQLRWWNWWDTAKCLNTDICSILNTPGYPIWPPAAGLAGCGSPVSPTSWLSDVPGSLEHSHIWNRTTQLHWGNWIHLLLALWINLRVRGDDVNTWFN